MTERLTEYDSHGDLCVKNHDYISVSHKLAHYEDLEEQLENLYGGKMLLDKVVENLNRIVQNGEEKLDYARILTNAEAEKWDRWLDLEEADRLIELPFAAGDTVWIIAPNYYKCDNTHSCEDYDSEEYLITWCQRNCPNGYQGRGAIQCVIDCIEIYNDKICVQLTICESNTYYRLPITNIFLTKEEAEAKLKERGEQE